MIMQPEVSGRNHVGERIEWPRYWMDTDGRQDFVVEDYFPDPDAARNEPVSAFPLDDLAAEGCLVLLGEPGLGKSDAIREAHRRSDARTLGGEARYIDMGGVPSAGDVKPAIVDSRSWRHWRDHGAELDLYIDNLDEAPVPPRRVIKTLVALLGGVEPDALARLRLRIACRTADWHSTYTAELRRFSSEQGLADPRQLQLAPLRKADARLAADRWGVDADEFVDAVRVRDIEYLAAVPLTLFLLLGLAHDEQQLPASRADLFAKATLRLAANTDPGGESERMGQTPGERVAVAERIAAVTLIAGEPAIALDSSRARSTCLDPVAITGGIERDVSGPSTPVFEVTAQRAEDTLETALFIQSVAGSARFLHRSLAEFLAGRYLARHDLTASQLGQLLVAPGDFDDGPFVPELREVAAWAACSGSTAFAEVLRRQPDLLVRADGPRLSAEWAGAVLDALLVEDVAERVSLSEPRIAHNLQALDSPELIDRLRECVCDPTRGVCSRELAIAIARACRTTELIDDVIRIALDEDEATRLRDDAVRALGALASRGQLLALLPLAKGQKSDTDDQLKGTALQTLCPRALPVCDVFAYLSEPKERNFIGAYRMFLSHHLPELLEPVDLPAALAWAASVEPDDQPHDPLPMLADRILASAWPHAADDSVFEGIVDAVRVRAVAGVSSLGGTWEGPDPPDIPHQIKLRIVEALTPHVEVRDGQPNAIHPFNLMMTSPRLVTVDDLEWALEQLDAAIRGPLEENWAAVVDAIHRVGIHGIEPVYPLYEQSEALRARLEGLFAPVPLESEAASRMRSRHDDEVRREKRSAEIKAETAEARRDRSVDADNRLTEELDRIADGEVDQWCTVLSLLRIGKPGQHEPHRAWDSVPETPGWKRADVDVRNRIADAALSFLQGSVLDASPNVEDTRHALGMTVAAYHALLLVRSRHPEDEDLRVLERSRWEHWMPAIVSYPFTTGFEGSGNGRSVFRLAVQRAPDVAREVLLRRIKAESSRDEGLFVLKRLGPIDSPSVAAAVFDCLNWPALPRRSVADLVEWGLAVDPERVRRYLEPLVTAIATARGVDGEKPLVADLAALVLSRAPGPTWAWLQPLLSPDAPFTAAAFRCLAGRSRADLITTMTDADLAALTVLVWQAFPPNADPPLKLGISDESPAESVRWLRSDLVQALALRGTTTAVDAFQRLSATADGRKSLQHYQRMAEDAFRSRRPRPSPAEIIGLAQHNDASIIRGPEHLIQLVKHRVDRLQDRYHRGDHSLVTDLWDLDSGHPQHEEPISDVLADHLRKSLSGARVIDREVQAVPSQTGTGRSRSIDLKISAATGTLTQHADVATVVIEVKGLWHQDVMTALETQLAKQYLLPAGLTHGIYLVLWFPPSRLRRRLPTSRAQITTLTGARAYFTEQARAVSETTQTNIDAVVFDGTPTVALPDPP